MGHFENRESVAVDCEDAIAQATSSIEENHTVLSKDRIGFKIQKLENLAADKVNFGAISGTSGNFPVERLRGGQQSGPLKC